MKKAEKNISVIALNTHDTEGGAARAAYRIHSGVKACGIASKMLVKVKKTNDNTVFDFLFLNQQKWFPVRSFNKIAIKIKNYFQKSRWKKYSNKSGAYMSDCGLYPLRYVLNKFNYDILHLHWLAGGFIDICGLNKIKKPIVWTLHDCSPFTGGCHYFYQCEKYKLSCGRCPLLKSENDNDLTRLIWKRKLNAYKDCDIHIVSPSKWLGACAKESRLFARFPVSVIPNGIDTNLFKPCNKTEARSRLGLKNDTKYVLFGAVNVMNDSCKGLDLLQGALLNLKNNGRVGFELLVFGADKPLSPIVDPGYSVHYMGVIGDDACLVDLYNAADISVVPSRSENLSNVIMESLACGTPVVAFNLGGNPDMLDHRGNGYLANAYESNSLAEGIEWLLNNNFNSELSKCARQKVMDNFAVEKISKRYKELYGGLLS